VAASGTQRRMGEGFSRHSRRCAGPHISFKYLRGAAVACRLLPNVRSAGRRSRERASWV
jgi:hypothetical protein